MNETTDLIIPELNDVAERDDGNNSRASWNTSVDHIRTQTAHFKQEETEAIIALFRWCTNALHPMSRVEAAKRLSCSPELIYQLMTGKYRNPDKSPKGPSAEFMRHLREFLLSEAKRFARGRSQFVMTPTAKKIITAFDLARESQSIVFIYGPSQIGKTWTAELHYVPTHNHGRTIYCRMAAASGLGGMLRAMAKAAGISAEAKPTDLIRRIKAATSANTLWILDEVHLLANTYRKGSFFACMEVIREIYDETQCGMALIFTMLDDLRAASQKELQQLWRRGVHKVPLPLMPTKGDIGAILAHHEMDFPDKKLEVTVKGVTESPYEILRQQAKNNGLKAITERLRYARKLADRDGAKAVTWAHFVEAHLIIEKQALQEGIWE